MECPNCNKCIFWIDDTQSEDEKYSHISQYECHACGIYVEIHVPKGGSNVHT